MRRSFPLAAAFLSVAALVSAKAPITHEDVFLMKQVGAPVPSPDGKWVVFSLNEPAYDESKQISDLWLVPADGSAPPRRLTNTKGPETGVAWSADSRRIAFSAKREGDDVNQIYMLDIAGGGEAVRVTSLSTGAAAPRWRPDGLALAFTSMVYPGAATDEANKKAAAARKGLKYHARVYETFPIRYWDHWLDDRQIHLFVQELNEGAQARDLLAGTQLVANSGFGGTETNAGEELVSAWAPDGQSLVFAATANRTEAAYARVLTRLYQVRAGGGEPKALTFGNESFRKPVFRPDGKALYALAEQEGDKVYYDDRIAMLPWPANGEYKLVTASADLSVSNFAFTPDSRTVYYLAEDSGLEKLFQVPAEGGDAREAFPMKSGCYTNLAIPPRASTTVLLADWESATNPAEIVHIDGGSGANHRLTSFNVEHASQFFL